jgi:hypothetical protein
MTDFSAPAPAGWEREVPKYRATRDLDPAERARYRSEPPFANQFGADIWQYSDRPIKQGEIISTTAWPHPSLAPLNHSAAKVLDFFNNATKSRLALSPWFGGEVRLATGLSGPLPTIMKPPQLRTANLRPVA